MYRLRTGFSHDDIAFLLGAMCGSNVCRHEQGQRIPSLRTLLAYEIVLGASPRELFEGVFHEVQELVVERARGLHNYIKRRPRAPRRRHRLATLQSLLDKADMAA